MKRYELSQVASEKRVPLSYVVFGLALLVLHSGPRATAIEGTPSLPSTFKAQTVASPAGADIFVRSGAGIGGYREVQFVNVGFAKTSPLNRKKAVGF